MLWLVMVMVMVMMISSSSSSDDDFDVGYLEDVAAEQEQQRRGRLTTSTRRVFQGRVSALRIFCVVLILSFIICLV